MDKATRDFIASEDALDCTEDGRLRIRYRGVLVDLGTLKDGATPEDVRALVERCGYRLDEDVGGQHLTPYQRFQRAQAQGRYRVAPDKTVLDCDDWLARHLRTLRTVRRDARSRVRSDFDMDGFNAVLKENGVLFEGKWARLPEAGTRGWQGRYRACGRQKLEQRVLRTGTLYMNGTAHEAPLDWLRATALKNPKTPPCFERTRT